MRIIVFILLLPFLLSSQTEVFIHPTQVGLFGATTGSFLRAGASAAQWETAASLQGTLLLPSGASTGQVVEWNGSAWVPGTDNSNAADSAFARNTLGSPLYWGKSIGENIWRLGRTGFKTTNSTGVLNLMPGFGTSVPGIFIPDSSDIFLQIGADSRGDSLGDFLMTNRYFDNTSEVGDNQVFLMGFNTNSGGGKLEADKASMTISMEEKYDTSPDGNKRPSYELHIPEVDLKYSGGMRRPISGLFGHEARFGGSIGMTMDFLQISDYRNNSPKVVWGFAENGYTKGIDFQDTAQLRFGVNNWNIFSQKKAGAGFVDVIKVDNLDQIKLGGGGESRVAAFNHFRITNSGLLTNENGEIYIGNSTFPTRLLVQHNTSNLITLARTGAAYTNTLSIFNSQFYYQSSNGNTPFMVDLTAPSYSLWVRESGRVGLGTASPQRLLHLVSTGGATTPLIRIENTTGVNELHRTTADPNGAVSGNIGDLALSNVSSVGELWLKREINGSNTNWEKVATGIERNTIYTYYREVALPVVVNNTVYIGNITFNGGGGGGYAEITVTAEDGGTGVSITKGYTLPFVFSATSGNWQTLLPVASTGNRLGEDFALEMRSAGSVDSIRIRRKAGTTSSNARCSIILKNTSGLSATYFTPITKTWNGAAVPGSIFNYNSFAAEKNRLGVMTADAAQTLHVEGTARITGSTGTPNSFVGRDGNGDIGIISVGPGLSLSGGVISNTGDLTSSNDINTVQDDGVTMTARQTLNFVTTSTINMALTDNAGLGTTEIRANIPTGAVGATEIASSGVTAATYGSGSAVPVITVDQDGRITSATTSAVSATNIYNTDGTLTGARNLNCGTAYPLTIDASGWSSSPAQPLIVKGKESSFSTRFFEYQDETATWRARWVATASLISLSTNSRPLELIGSTYVRNTAGTANLEVNSNGYIALEQRTSDPSSPANSSFWAHNTDGRMKVRFNSATENVSTIEKDMIGNAPASKTANFTLQAQDFHLILDANAGSFTATLDGTMREGIMYSFECRRNGTNTITFDAGAGYNLSFPGISSFPDDGTVAVGGAGTGDQAPHRNYAFKRMGTSIIFY